ncbi:hypothetical protein DSO57_1027147 [Entomophthora muscae]|uniref:Uncharacterized protein n=1 Tax=Entomophthora muscae TaxID=34485 RepID=A0ACC2S3Q5_9FUNG|nr:hypothetical protein DSO57_1027147 [Entomophthora muscae]
MVIYGGIDGSASDPYKAQALTDTYVFNITSRLWYKPNIKNTPTKGAKFHSAANYNNSNTMHVFTGPSSGLVSLDTNSWEWTSPISPPSQISKNLGATMVASGNSLILYGGVEFDSDGAPDASKVSDAVYTYELTSRKWFLMPNGNKLYFHSSCYAPGQTEEIIFGGATADGALSPSVIALSTSAFQFYLNRVSSQTPPQLIGSTLACIGSNGVLMGGGGLDWKPTSAMVQLIGNAGGPNPEFLWSQAPIKDSGMAPGPRIGHTAAVLGSDIFVYGGVGANDINVYKLSTTTWEWEVLSSPNTPGSPIIPTSPNSNFSTSRNTQVIIIAIVSALFGVLMMGVIIAVCLRHWRQKSRILKKDSASGLAVDSMYRGPETRAWADSSNNTPARYSSYSNSNLDVRRTPAIHTPTLHLEEEECWTVGETNSYSVISGQEDTANSVAPVRYLRPLSPLSPQRTFPSESISSNFLPRPYPHQSEEGLAALQSTSDVVSPLDRIARLHAAVEEQEPPAHCTSELSTPTSSIQNWPFLARDALPLSRESGLNSQLSLLSFNPQVASPTHPAGLDSILHKRLSAKYRITASSLVMPLGSVSVVQATEIASLAPVAILLYLNKYDWDRDCEMLQILEGPFAPRLKESFQVPSAGKTHYVLVQERLGTPLPDILRRQAQPFSDLDLRLLIKGMARVLDFCHSRGVVLVDFQPTDLAFSSDTSSSQLMLARVESCHIEGDKFHRDAPSRYCPLS